MSKTLFCASGENRLLHSRVLFHLAFARTEKPFDSRTQAKQLACSLAHFKKLQKRSFLKCASGENRTRARCLGSTSSTTKLHSQFNYLNKPRNFCHKPVPEFVRSTEGLLVLLITVMTASPGFATLNLLRISSSCPLSVLSLSI